MDSKIISLDEYRDRVKGAWAGQFMGVSYGYPVEFHTHSFMGESAVPAWREAAILEGYNQDDIYLSAAAVEVYEKFGLAVSSRTAAIELYNKDFEYWNGSNNDVLARGYAPPLSGYPFGRGNLTTLYPDGNSYQCGISFAGLIAPFMPALSNKYAETFAEINGYGDGIYGAQFIAAMYAEAFFEKDLRKLIDAGLAVIPEDSWTALAVKDAVRWFDEGKPIESAHVLFMNKYWYGEEYNWITWPYGVSDPRTDGINLDAKACAAFVVFGLLYGKGDFAESTKYTVRCGNDTDSTAAATAGILATTMGFGNIPDQYKSGLLPDQKIKYTRYTIDTLVEACVNLAKQTVTDNGGSVGVYQGKEVLVIPVSAHRVTVGEYQCSRNPGPIEQTLFSDAERAQMRLIIDPGFERHNGNSLANGWRSTLPAQVSVEYYTAGKARTGLANALIQSSTAFQDVYTTIDTAPNSIYELSVYVMANKGFAGENIKLFARNTNSVVLREAEFKAPGAWTRISLSFNTMNYNAVQIGVGFTGKNNIDTLRVDDIEISKAK
ncbi:hypothetical protein FACS1894130_09850 [Spirochaetia bacterium]|nr:hypothetical protein FACS1894130_09850 [Spirochaetia bacterium]